MRPKLPKDCLCRQHGHGEDDDLGVCRLPEIARRHVYGVEGQRPAAHGRSAGKTGDVVAGLPQGEAERAADQPQTDNGYSSCRAVAGSPTVLHHWCTRACCNGTAGRRPA